jgi:beta-N-acetylhexosaminidase
VKLGPGALVWAGFDGPEVPGPLLDAIRTGQLGGLLLFAIRGNVRSKDQVRAMLRAAEDAARQGGLAPVPIAVDQEGGTVVRVAYRAVFPSAMAIGATGDPSYAERAARAVAEGLLADGITVNHAPVCDVNVEPRNPVIGTRAFGDDPARVAAFAAAWVRGSEGAGVATTPKHFPGHGTSPVDSHYTTVDVKDDAATLRARDLVPFRAAFEAGATMVMTAHVRYPAFDPEAVATISRPILTTLLREELGFRGLCVTDSLDMSGITQVEDPATVVGRAIAAGVDAVMVTSGLDKQLAAAERISIGAPAPRVLEALRRATAFRERFAGRVSDGDVDDGPARALAAEIAEASVTYVGPPLPRGSRALRVTGFQPRRVGGAEELQDPLGALEAALRRRLGDGLSFERDGREPAGEGTLVVCTSSAWHDAEQASRARQLLRNGGVVCALRSPYDAVLFPDVPALLTYGDVPVSLEALAAVLTGERPARGRLPVRLPTLPVAVPSLP